MYCASAIYVSACLTLCHSWWHLHNFWALMAITRACRYAWFHQLAWHLRCASHLSVNSCCHVPAMCKDNNMRLHESDQHFACHQYGLTFSTCHQKLWWNTAGKLRAENAHDCWNAWNVQPIGNLHAIYFLYWFKYKSALISTIWLAHCQVKNAIPATCLASCQHCGNFWGLPTRNCFLY